ncbi:MAG: hypothetical protein ABEI31_03525 [Halodesulfurarchaeum sp.]
MQLCASPSAVLYNTFGEQKEGRIRNDIVVDGEPRDSVRYSITRSEWAAHRDGA